MFRFKFFNKLKYFFTSVVEEAKIKAKMVDKENEVAKVTIKGKSFAAEYGDKYKNKRSGIVIHKNGKDYYMLNKLTNGQYTVDEDTVLKEDYPTSYTNITTLEGTQNPDDYDDWEGISVKEDLTSIKEGAFEGCSSLTDVTIPSTVTSIGDNAFNGCSSLKDVTIPESVTSIGNNVFSDCSSLKDVTIPDTITSIGDNAFNGCSSLKDVTIPESVTSIGNNAFNDCTALSSVEFKSTTVPTMGDNIFNGCSSLKEITVPKEAMETYNNTEQLSNYVPSYTFTITQSDNEAITIKTNRGTYTSTFTAYKGDTWTASIVATTTGYNAGTLSASSGTVTGNVSVSATDASLKSHTFTITQSSNETITVKTSRGTYTSTFTAYYGDTWSASVSPSTGYNAGSLSASSGTITDNVSVSATAASLKSYTFTITQSSNETITVKTSRGTYTSTFTAYYGDTWSASVSPATGYNAGSLSASSGTITGNASVSVGAASLKSYTFTITQNSNETITVKTNRGTYTSAFTAYYGDTWSASVSPATGYNAGSLSASSGTITDNVSVSATAASLKSYTFTITQSSNETITVKTNRGTYTSTFTAYYGDTWTASVSPSTGYNAGSLSASSGTITGNASVSVTAATVAIKYDPYLTFQSTASLSIKTYHQFKQWNGTLEYSTDLSTWTTWNGTSTISSSSGIIYMRGTGNNYVAGSGGESCRWIFTTTGELKCIGNIENLLDYQTVAKYQHPTMTSNCFNSMFYNCTSLIQAPELPATTLAEYCYDSMFFYCTSLTQAPALPATTLAKACYGYMFYNCTSLTQTLELPATTLAAHCYESMLYGCKKLTAVHLPSSVKGNSNISSFPDSSCTATIYYDL